MCFFVSRIFFHSFHFALLISLYFSDLMPKPQPKPRPTTKLTTPTTKPVTARPSPTKPQETSGKGIALDWKHFSNDFSYRFKYLQQHLFHACKSYICWIISQNARTLRLGTVSFGPPLDNARNKRNSWEKIVERAVEFVVRRNLHRFSTCF